MKNKDGLRTYIIKRQPHPGWSHDVHAIEFTAHAETDMHDLIDLFESFLRACNYPLPLDHHLAVVDEDGELSS